MPDVHGGDTCKGDSREPVVSLLDLDRGRIRADAALQQMGLCRLSRRRECTAATQVPCSLRCRPVVHEAARGMDIQAAVDKTVPHEQRRRSESMSAQVRALPGASVVEGLNERPTVEPAAQVAGGVGAHGQDGRVRVDVGAIRRWP